MSESEKFLSRWSRRKAAALESEAAETPETEAHASEQQGSDPSGGTERKQEDSSQTENTEPEFDLKSLPPIDSIEAGTDISAFLRTGVPAELARAALRRAWAADPSIRDFIGLSENSWDFTAPNAIPGFGPLSANDATQLMAQYAGKLQEVVSNVVGEAKETVRQLAHGNSRSSLDTGILPPLSSELSDRHSGKPEVEMHPAQETKASPKDSDNPLQCSGENAASQDDFHIRSDDRESSRPTRRSHGGALPT